MVYRLILVVFFVSGALGLGYQVLWSKFLLDFIGVSAYSYATVLSSFMAGLALGSVYLGKFADRSKAPLRLYAWLELGVGLYAFAYLPLTRWVADVYGGFVDYGAEGGAGTAGLTAKIVVSGLLLIPPTFLLGGTFPAMVRHATHNLGVLGRRVSELYALNALGAVVGTLGMAFVVLPLMGMKGSLYALAIGNILVAAIAWMLGGERQGASAGAADSSGGSASDRAEDAAASEATVPATSGARASTVVPPALVRLALLLVMIEGAFSFIYEIAWTRYFGVILGSSTYSFAIMLAAFITGISLGSAILSRIEKRIGNPLAFFGWTQLIVGLLVLLPLPLYTRIPGWFLLFANQVSTDASSFYLYELGKLVFCYLFMLPPTLLIGMAIPLLIKGLSRDLVRLGSDTGRIYAWNTWGSVLGSLAAGLLLLPLLGVETMLAMGALGNIALGIGAVWAFRDRTNPAASRAPVAAIPLLVLVLVYHIATRGWDASWFTLLRLTSGAERSRLELTLPGIREYVDGIEVRYQKDDPAANLMVTRRIEGTEPVYTLFVNGKPDASSKGDLPTQYLSGHLPALFHREPKDALVIGLASGITAGSMLLHEIDRLDVIELLRAMPEATKFFDPWNERPLEDPRCRLIIDDARSYLLYTEQRYDIIISEPSNPWMIGTGALFSRDFYERARHALREDGLYLQWISAYELSDESMRAVLRSFHSVFPYIYAFQGMNVDVLLLGSRKPLDPDWDRIEEVIASNEGVQRQLDEIGVTDLGSLLWLQRYGPTTVEYLASLTSLVNTDDNHFLEYRAPRDFFQGLAPVETLSLDERPTASASLLWSQWYRDHSSSFDRYAAARALTEPGVEIPPIANAYLLASMRMEDSSFDRSREQHPELYGPLFEGGTSPLTNEEFFSSFEEAVEAQDDDGAIGLVNRYGFPAVIEVSMSQSAGREWLRRLDRWASLARTSRMQKIVAKLRIDVLVASRQIDEAYEALRAANTGNDPVRAEWILIRAARLGDAEKFRTITRDVHATRPTESTKRLIESWAKRDD